jgi:hypothetical protein
MGVEHPEGRGGWEWGELQSQCDDGGDLGRNLGRRKERIGVRIRNEAESSLRAFRTRDVQRLRNKGELPHATPRI